MKNQEEAEGGREGYTEEVWNKGGGRKRNKEEENVRKRGERIEKKQK